MVGEEKGKKEGIMSLRIGRCGSLWFCFFLPLPLTLFCLRFFCPLSFGVPLAKKEQFLVPLNMDDDDGRESGEREIGREPTQAIF